ncbi:cyclin-dependent kinase 2-associated protein 1-like [Schistocerca americana]|uniref:cyclin-dependent kinase 2-associated protein 1-like n=1 Tax=Schistocerca americana TaxID=7009 RepID=UPI001F5016EC|nr:cyclin-dependent kinase 2-associated protein 1-like [Schistocerca americana]XP_049776108.1 cyclin-dependent kinase 2-associated protein 1-like [Schistocerca cancellata]XP_049800323.1 cyclin-dependent kinase 2-associated protein 1-like [Schistocerca nitens]XP_049855040.1 cyclin-dependent kinase 2-associated protein 1-like [Schistocerca gregaria]XP_049947452.1 cyclin-dependent kinase 2-associated protein 1-like [Schistocerca serialis cubense]
MMMDDDIQSVDSPMTPSAAATMMLPADLMSSPGAFPTALGSGANVLRQHPAIPPAPPGQSKYAQLLAVIEEMGKDIRPTYAGSKSSAERLKRGIVHARILVRECLMETERSARQ